MAKEATAPNFGAILDKPASAVERPRPFPVGSYTCIVRGLPRMDKSSKKGTEFVEFNLVPQSAGDDVDPDELKAFLTKADGSKAKLVDKTIKATYYLTDDSLWRLKDFLGHLGFDMDGDSTLRAAISESQGQKVIVNMRHEPSDDGKTMYAKVKDTAPAE